MHTGYLSASEVQNFLNNILEGEMMTVTFEKKDGSVVTYHAELPIAETRKELVAIKTSEGYKKFSINKVLEISK